MSTGSWDPQADDAAKNIEMDDGMLERLAGYSRSEQLDELAKHLKQAESQRLAGLMAVDHAQWLAAAESLNEDQLFHLIRFFAAAENLPGWEAGELSPVIPLARALRKRGQRLDREFLLWLRQVNDNKFLPYGPL